MLECKSWQVFDGKSCIASCTHKIIHMFANGQSSIYYTWFIIQYYSKTPPFVNVWWSLCLRGVGVFMHHYYYFPSYEFLLLLRGFLSFLRNLKFCFQSEYSGCNAWFFSLMFFDQWSSKIVWQVHRQHQKFSNGDVFLLKFE